MLNNVEVWLHPMVFDLEKEKVMVRPGPLHVQWNHHCEVDDVKSPSTHMMEMDRTFKERRFLVGRCCFACILEPGGLACSMISVLEADLE